jgi:hypothetical protein
MIKHAILAMGGNTDGPPTNYKPLTVAQKTQWNNFLHYLEQQGIGGKVDLDQGQDQTADLINDYKKVNKNFGITPQMVPFIQYEIQMMKQGKIPDDKGNFIDINNSVVGKAIPMLFKGRNLSPVDGRIGSLTSVEAYPIPWSNDLHKNWGTDYWTYMNEVNNYLNKTKGIINNPAVAISAMASSR